MPAAEKKLSTDEDDPTASSRAIRYFLLLTTLHLQLPNVFVENKRRSQGQKRWPSHNKSTYLSNIILPQNQHVQLE